MRIAKVFSKPSGSLTAMLNFCRVLSFDLIVNRARVGDGLMMKDGGV